MGANLVQIARHYTIFALGCPQYKKCGDFAFDVLALNGKICGSDR
jgi:hypothetical protein